MNVKTVTETKTSDRRWKRKYRRLERALLHAGAVPKVKMQLEDGRFVYGVFVPFSKPWDPRGKVEFRPPSGGDRSSRRISSRPHRG